MTKTTAYQSDGNGGVKTVEVESCDPVICSPYEFLQRFTQAERIIIESSSDVYVKDFSTFLKAAHEVDFEDANTLAGMTYLVSLGLLTEERKNEILTH